MKLTHFIYLVLFSSITVLSCSTGPDFKRDNENDPESSRFSPNTPVGQNYSVDEEGNVHLTWKDSTDFESAYRIYKKLGEENPFFLLAELDKNATEYVDGSKKLAYPTAYRIVSVADSSESTPVEFKINFGSIASFSVSKETDNLALSWEDDVSQEDGFLITRYSDLDKQEKLAHIAPPNIQSQILPIIQDGFIQTYTITPFQVTDGDTTYAESRTDSVNATGPTNLQVQVSFPDTINIGWEDNSDFEVGYELSLELNGNKETLSLPANSNNYEIIKELNDSDNVSASVKAFSGSLPSPSTPVDDISLSNILSPIIDSIITISETDFKLIIKEPSNVGRNLDILRKTNEGTFIKIGTIDTRKDSVFKETNKDKFSDYYYKFSGPLIDNPNTFPIHYSLELDKVFTKDGEFSYMNTLAYSNNLNQLIFTSASRGRTEKITFLDLATKQEYNIQSPIEEAAFLVTNQIGNKFLLHGRDRDVRDTFYLYDANTRKRLRSIKVQNLDFLRDVIFLPNTSSILISGQFYRESTGEYSHKGLLYDLENDQFEQIFDNKRAFFYLDQAANRLFTYSSNRFSGAGSITIDEYEISGTDLSFKGSESFSGNIEFILGPSISASQDLDTHIITARDGGFYKLTISTGEVEFIDDNSTDAYFYSPRYTLTQKPRSVNVLKHFNGNIKITDTVAHSRVTTFFPTDFLYLKEDNLIIDVQSNYGAETYLESKLRTFNLRTRWAKLVDSSE